MKFLIPSYKRSDKQKALDYLTGMGYERSEIYISTQTQDDYDIYKRLYSDRANVIFRPGHNYPFNVNTLLLTLQQGEKAILLDDDIQLISLYRKPDAGQKHGTLQPITTRTELDRLFDYMFRTAQANDCPVFAASHLTNLLFIESSNEKGPLAINRKLGGGLMGIVRNETLFDEDFDSKNDHDYALQQAANGHNYCVFNAVILKRDDHQAGGCHDVHANGEEVAAQKLIAKWPFWVKHAKQWGEVRIRV